MTDTTPTTAGIAANLTLLRYTMQAGATTALSAESAFDAGERNLAIGTLLPLVEELKLASGLLQTIFTLHQLPSITIGDAR